MSVSWDMSQPQAPVPTHPCRSEVSFGTGAHQIDPRAIVRVGHALRDRVVEVYNEAGVTLPQRRIWTVADYPVDCDQLVVAFVNLTEDRVPGETDGQPKVCHIPVLATFTITVSRCIPLPDNSGKVPDVEVIDASTDQLVTDAYLLMKAACRFDMFGADVVGLDPSALGGRGVDANVVGQSAQGGTQSIVLTLTTVIG